MALSKPGGGAVGGDRQSGRQEAGRKPGAIRVSMGSPQDETPSGKENAMPIYVTLLRFTEKGIQHVKDTVKRSEAYGNEPRSTARRSRRLSGPKARTTS